MLATCVCAASLTLCQWQAPLKPMPAKAWWLVLPVMVLLCAFMSMRHLPQALLRYAY
ncbi:hypothetical protein P308_28815 [Pseudomonas piscis]|nr:hypothetical protein P308_28815 [Pseudomonas piscis]